MYCIYYIYLHTYTYVLFFVLICIYLWESANIPSIHVKCTSHEAETTLKLTKTHRIEKPCFFLVVLDILANFDVFKCLYSVLINESIECAFVFVIIAYCILIS